MYGLRRRRRPRLGFRSPAPSSLGFFLTRPNYFPFFRNSPSLWSLTRSSTSSPTGNLYAAPCTPAHLHTAQPSPLRIGSACVQIARPKTLKQHKQPMIDGKHHAWAHHLRQPCGPQRTGHWRFFIFIFFKIVFYRNIFLVS